LQKRKNKDNRGNKFRILISTIIGALHAMKQMKMLEKELASIDGMKTLLEQQKFMIESNLS